MKTFKEFMSEALDPKFGSMRKRGGRSAPPEERSVGGEMNRRNKDYWADTLGKNRDRGAGNKAKRRAAALNAEEFEIEEGMDMRSFKERRRKLQRKEASDDAKKRGHVDKFTGKPYSTAEAESRRRDIHSPAKAPEREARRRFAENPD